MRLALSLLFVLACLLARARGQNEPSDKDWPAYGGTLAGQRYTPYTQINLGNVDKLEVAWVFHTGVFGKPSAVSNHRANFEATPVLWNRALFFDTPFDEIFAIDALTGRKLWSFDPGVDRDGGGIYIVTSRGVALWHGKGPSGEPCGQHRVFVATLDRRLIARDAQTGARCEQFGSHGTVDLAAGMNLSGRALTLLSFTSPPTIVGDTVILGSSVGDNQSIDVAPGIVRAFDARTGRQLWAWDPIPWSVQHSPRTGSGGAWSILSADPEHDMVYIPTGSPSTDFYGGARHGDDRDADSIVALQASTGKRIWAFQFVHHDLWDYDTPSEPLLFTFRHKIPAVAVVNKTGMTFVFNRLTGETLYPIEERPVPQTTLPEEQTSRTQPFSSLPTLAPLNFTSADLTIEDPTEKESCTQRLNALVNTGIFTPPSLKNTLMYPGSLGGANWGSPAIDPATGVMYVHNNSFAYVFRQIRRPVSLRDKVVRLYERGIPSKWLSADSPAYTRYRTPDGGERSPQGGTPYELYREGIITPKGTLCSPQPWGSMVAINLNTGKKLWAVPHGTMKVGATTGSIGVGGPVVTAGGLVFVGATLEPVLRAFNARDGSLVWQHGVPAAVSATPMSYRIDGRQFLVVAAGGAGMLGTSQGDALVAFALPGIPRDKSPPPTPRKNARRFKRVP